jgi:hypothetical protein
MFISKSNFTTIGWTVSPCFNITLHIRDLDTLKAIQMFFNGVREIATNNKLASGRAALVPGEYRRSPPGLIIELDLEMNYK